MNGYDSLEKMLDHWFGFSFHELPSPLKRRVIANYWIAIWDDLTPAQRRSVARHHDHQHDPAIQDDREFWINFYANIQNLERKIEEWEHVDSPTALDLHQKESELQALQEKKAHLLRLKDIFLERRFLRIVSDSESESDKADEKNYLAFPAALERLRRRLNTSMQEIAAWILIGPDEGGLTAFSKPRYSSGVSRFQFRPEMEPDYESLLFNCWFAEVEIESFNPRERFMSGKALIARWKDSVEENARDFIQSKVIAGDLTDLHSFKLGKEAAAPASEGSVGLETGLFAMSQIEAVERGQGIKNLSDEVFMRKSDQESPDKRRVRLLQWIEVETRLRGKHGAIKRVAEREDVTRQRISQIIDRESE